MEYTNNGDDVEMAKFPLPNYHNIKNVTILLGGEKLCLKTGSCIGNKRVKGIPGESGFYYGPIRKGQKISVKITLLETVKITHNLLSSFRLPHHLPSNSSDCNYKVSVDVQTSQPMKHFKIPDGFTIESSTSNRIRAVLTNYEDYFKQKRIRFGYRTENPSVPSASY